MITKEDHIQFGTGHLLICGIAVYTKIGYSNHHIIYIDGELHKVFFHRARVDKHGSIADVTKISLANDYIVSNSDSYALMVDIEAQLCWLIPMSDIWNARSIRLGPKYDKYKLTYRRMEAAARIERSIQVTQTAVHKSLKNKLKGNEIRTQADDVASIFED